MSEAKEHKRALHLACLGVLLVLGLMIDLKGISSDEGMRLGIINGGSAFTSVDPGGRATWAQVLDANFTCAYQPLYLLLQNTLMRAGRTHDVVFFRLVNVFFLWVSLQGLLVLSARWRLVPRLFLIGLFSGNAYLIMHVLQIREYVLAMAFYIWSTCLVLRLDGRALGRPWADAGWFAGYGVLLTLGFYVQTWVVFPAIGQFLFLVARRRTSPLRFYFSLALGYAVVLSATIPYLLTHMRKVNVGRWGTEHTALWPQLSNGFHLVFAGHVAGFSSFTDLLFWFWPGLITGSALLLFRQNSATATGLDQARGDFRRQGLLMLLSSAVPLAFQLGYFFKLDNLSLWPRYFIIHYFFLIWLAALGFNFLWSLRATGAQPAWLRHALSAAVAACLVVMGGSAVFQVRSYYRNPYFDTSLVPSADWLNLAREVSRHLQPRDAVVFHDYIARATLTFSQPLINPAWLLDELETYDFKAIDRLVYLESGESPEKKADIAARMTALGYSNRQVLGLFMADGQTPLSYWRAVVYSRP